VVGLAYGNTARSENKVVPERCFPEPIRNLLLVVAKDAAIARVAAQSTQHRAKHEAVRVEELRGAPRKSRRHNLVAIEKTATRTERRTSTLVRPSAAQSATFLWSEPSAVAENYLTLSRRHLPLNEYCHRIEVLRGNEHVLSRRLERPLA
jgi:hypothetical protein